VAYLRFCERGEARAEGARFKALEAPWRVGCGRGVHLPPGRGLGRVLCPSADFILILGSKWTLLFKNFLHLSKKERRGHRQPPS